MPDSIAAVSETLFIPLYALALDARSPSPILVDEADVRALVVRIRDRFPGAELVAEVASRAAARISSGRLGRGKFRREFGLSGDVWMRSGLASASEMERWAEGITLLDDWNIFYEDEPRLGWIRAFARWDLIRRAVFVVRYRLG